MKKLILLIVCTYTIFLSAQAQELFPFAEPASTIPKGVGGMRYSTHTYKDYDDRTRIWNAFRFMYGLNKNTSVIVSANFSNHHYNNLPKDIGFYFRNHHSRAFPARPYKFDGMHAYVKYRFVTLDGKQRHLRAAVFGEISGTSAAHDEAEPVLLGDNAGWACGLIVTQLYKRLGISFTSSMIVPFTYKDHVNPVTFRSGNAHDYNLSFGYRLYPTVYRDYNDVNINLYVEFFTKAYDAAYITKNGKYYSPTTLALYSPFLYNSLLAGVYTEMRPSLQIILQSNTRIDLGVIVPVYKQSFAHRYPVISVNLQRYFFERKEW